MDRRFLACFILVLAVISCPTLVGNAQTAHIHAQSSESVPEAYVQITSVTVEPSIIHKRQAPRSAIVTVQVMLRGQAPPHAEAIIEVGTYSTDPPDDELKYENPTRTVPLEKAVTTAKFNAEITTKTVPGKIRVAATLGGATKGINVKPSDPEPLRAEMTVVEP